MHEAACLCPYIPSIDVETRVALVMHHREVQKPTATGPLALASLPNSELYVHGLRDAPLDLHSLHADGRRVLILFPSEGARPLSPSLKEEDPRPVTLVVPDGNWRQATRIPRRIPGLENALRVTLPQGSTSWGIRQEPKPHGLATFEAIAQALGILESVAVQEQLEALFRRMVNATLAAQGLAELPCDEAALSVIYRDDHLVAVNKPSGMPVHRGWARDGLPALQRVRAQLGRYVYPVHRLDRATSGVLIFALSSEVARDMQQIFARDGMKKRYLALCRGRDPGLRCVDHPLAKNKAAEPRPAVTEFRLLGAFERYGLYEAFPHSGRTHQIRRHLKHVSHPIIGDVRYGKGEHNRAFRERFGFHRLALHCHRMNFGHPRTGDPVSIEAPLSDDFGALLRRFFGSTP